VQSCEKLPPCLIKPVPAGSKTDASLAKAKPISDGGSVSGTTYLRRGSPMLEEADPWREEPRPEQVC